MRCKPSWFRMGLMRCKLCKCSIWSLNILLLKSKLYCALVVCCRTRRNGKKRLFAVNGKEMYQSFKRTR